MKHGKRWSELSTRQRVLIVVLAVVQITLAVTAGRDLRHRRPEELTAPKWCWRMALGVNFFGPIAYFVWGRRPAPVDEAAAEA